MITLFKKSHICVELFGYKFHLHYFKKKVEVEINQLQADLAHLGDKQEVSKEKLDRLIELKNSIDWYML